MKFVLFTILFSIGAQASECGEFKRFYGVLDMEKKTWQTMRIDETKKRICDKLFETPDSNIEVSLTNGKQNFSVKIFRNMYVYFDRIENGKTVGGKVPETILAINSFFPVWGKDSVITFKEISSGKILAKGKL